VCRCVRVCVFITGVCEWQEGGLSCVCVCACVRVYNRCLWVGGGRAQLWDTAHSWLSYSRPQNKKAAWSIYRPQDDCKSHRPGSRPETLHSASPPSTLVASVWLLYSLPRLAGPWIPRETETPGWSWRAEASRSQFQVLASALGDLLGFLETPSGLLACSGDLSRKGDQSRTRD
jgi:hypothetical protein